MLDAGDTFTHIATVLKRGLSTVSEEVNKNGGRKKYDPGKAAERARLKQYHKKKDCSKVALDGPLSRYVQKKLEDGWSPETISRRLDKKKELPYVSAKSIRVFIKRRPGLERFLFWHRVHKKGGPKRLKESFLRDVDRKFIEMRPLAALYEYGHWEGDFIVSRHNSWVLLVLVEKCSKTVLLSLLPCRNNELVNKTIVSMLHGYKVKTLTLDNDIAFGKWRQLESMLHTQIYFCHPFHSWEKGLVENTNRWIREFIPKKADLALYSKGYIQWIESWFNHTPRQCLDGDAPYERMMVCQFKKEVESLEINLPRLRIWG